MAAISARYASSRPIRALPRAMVCTVTFYALRPGLDRVTVTVHRVERLGLMAYTGTPGVALAAARMVKGDPKADGFRVEDEDGRVLLEYVDRPGQG